MRVTREKAAENRDRIVATAARLFRVKVVGWGSLGPLGYGTGGGGPTREHDAAGHRA